MNLKRKLATGFVAVIAAGSLIGVGLGIGSIILPDRIVVVDVDEAISVSPDSITLTGVHPNETHSANFTFSNEGTEAITIEWVATVDPPTGGSVDDVLVVYEPSVLVPPGISSWLVTVTLANHVVADNYTITVSPTRAYIPLS